MSRPFTHDQLDAFAGWLSEAGTKLIRLNGSMHVLSTATFPDGPTGHWEGLGLLDFFRDRVVLTDKNGRTDLSRIAELAQWEGKAGPSDMNRPGMTAEVFFVRLSEGESLLRWKCADNVLQEDQHLLEIIFNSLTQGMLVTDPSGTVLRINPAIYRRMKQSESDRVGRKFWDSHEWQAYPQSIDRVVKDLHRAASGERVTEIYRTRPFNERDVYLKLQMHPVTDADGKVEFIAVEGTPVTQEVEDRKQLDLQRTLIRTFFEFIPLPVWVIDVSGRLIMMNDAYAEVYGLSESDIGKNIYAKRSEKISEQCIRNNQQVFRSGIPLHSVEYIRDLKGETRIFHVTKFPIESGEGESLVGGVSLDMTDKIGAEQKLRQALERFEYVSEATNDLIYDWNLQTGVVKLVGNAFGIYDELKDKEINIAQLQQYIHQDDLNRQSKRLEKTIKNKLRRDWHAEFRIRDNEGGYLHVMDRAAIHRDGTGMAYRIVGSIQDISAIHQLNKRLQDAQKLGFQRNQRVAYEVAERERNRIAEELHDNVNPLLAAARLHIGVSESSPDTAAENLLHSKSLIFDAIDVIRNMSQRISVALLKDRPLDDILRGFLRKQHDGEKPVVTVTGRKLEGLKDQYFKMNVLRIVQEQFANTLKYAHADHFQVDMSVKNGQLHLHIQDDGEGFDMASGRIGLGFSNIEGRVEAYGGKLRIVSTPGNGCNLTANFPIPENPDI